MFSRELTLELCGRPYLLRGNFHALRTLEATSGKMIGEIVNDLAERKLPVDIIAATIYGGLVGAENKEGLTLEKVQEMCFEHGIVSLMPDVSKFIVLCIAKKPNEVEKESEGKNGEPAQAGQPKTT